MNCLVSEEITTVELNEKISTNSFFLVPVGGVIWTQILQYGRAFDQQSFLRGREFDQQQFQKFKCPVVTGRGEDVEVSN